MDEDNFFSKIAKPIFMPDATYGIVNSISWQDLENIGTKAIVTNTLHVFLNYILPQLRQDNSLSLDNFHIADNFSFRKLTRWSGGILTDSGGFQAYSFTKHGTGKVLDDGIRFKDMKTGQTIKLTPQLSAQIQLSLRPDVITFLDDPIDPNVDERRILQSLKKTISWAKEFVLYLNDELIKINQSGESYKPILNFVVQGGNNLELRKKCFDELYSIIQNNYIFAMNNLPLCGWGGWPLDEQGNFLFDLAKFQANLSVNNNSSTNSISYAMGVGSPDDLVDSVNAGFYLFDCVLPTRNARHGLIYVEKGAGEASGKHFDILRITSQRYINDETPINNMSKIPELRNTSRKYLRHLFKIGDSNAYRIASLQNLEFYNQLLERL